MRRKREGGMKTTPNNTCKNACILQPIFYAEKCYPFITSVKLGIHSICLMVQFGSADRRRRNNPLPFEIRKVQDSTRILFVSIPKRFAQLLHIDKGTLLKIQLDSDPELGNRLIIQPLYPKDGEAI
jgi:hypothetical protein